MYVCMYVCIYIYIYMYKVRWKKCYHSTNSIMAGHVSKLYVDKFFPDENRQAALKMLGEIRDQFKEDLETVPWYAI
jgi:predicted metalloendopeptidase